MTIINTKKLESYPYLTPVQAAQIIGVSERTIYRWQKSRLSERYNHFIIYFNEIDLSKT